MRLHQNVPPSQDEDDVTTQDFQQGDDFTDITSRTAWETAKENDEEDTAVMFATSTSGFLRDDDDNKESNQLNLYNAAPRVSGVLITGVSLFLTLYGFYAGISGTDPLFQQYPTPVVQVL